MFDPIRRHFSPTGSSFVPSSETQGQSVGLRERARQMFSSTDYFQKFKRMPAHDWAQKILCIIMSKGRTVSPEFFAWGRTRRLLSCHTCPVRSPGLCEQGKLLFSTSLTRNEGTTDKMFRMISAGAIQFAPRVFCFWLITMYRK